MTPQERLKLRMQKALNKQSKADKKAAQVKIQQQENKRQEREGELRAMARKIRMKERERREKERDEWERQYGRQSHSPSPSKYGREHNYRRRSRSRSRSRSPHYRYWVVENILQNRQHRTLSLAHILSNMQAITWEFEEMDWLSSGSQIYTWTPCFLVLCVYKIYYFDCDTLVSVITQPIGSCLICLFLSVSSCKENAGLLNELLVSSACSFYFWLNSSSQCGLVRRCQFAFQNTQY